MDAERRRLVLAVGLAFGAIYGIWGSTYLAIAFAVDTIPPLLMIAARCLVAGALLYAWARLQGAPRPCGRTWRLAVTAGALLFASGQGLMAWAETVIPSGTVALVGATTPLFIVLLGWKVPGLTLPAGASSPTRGTWAALALGTAGVALLVAGGPGDVAPAARVASAGAAGASGSAGAAGVLAALVASASWAAGSLRAVRSRPPRPHPTRDAGMQLLGGGLVLLAIGLAGGEGARLRLAEISVGSALALAYLIVFGSLIAYSAYVWLLQRVPPERVASHAYVNPLIAVALGWAVAEEPLTPAVGLAAALIVTAVVVTLGGRSRRARVASPRWRRAAAREGEARAA